MKYVQEYRLPLKTTQMDVTPQVLPEEEQNEKNPNIL
jgi:hypothetical protein